MWKTLPFEDCIQKVKTPFKLPKKEYLEQGLYPVVSQEAALISGYHDDASHLFNVDEPVVIFGDHTQALKYIDFSFVMGADGVKILKPISDIDAKYFYYALTTLMPKGKGYARHYRLLKELNISFPPLAEQQRIVAKLDAAFAEIDDAVNTNLEQARNAKSLFESSRATLLSAENEDWAEKSLGDCCSRVSVGHVGSTSEYYCAEELGIPFLRSQNVKPARLELDGVRFITKAFHEKLKKSQLKANDILIVRVGANRGDCCLVPATVEELNCANIVFARPVEGNPNFLAHFCQSTIGRQRLMGMTTGAAQGVINTKSVATLRVPFPPLEHQRTIARKLDAINERAIELEKIYLERAHQTRLLKSAILAQELQPPQSEAA